MDLGTAAQRMAEWLRPSGRPAGAATRTEGEPSQLEPSVAGATAFWNQVGWTSDYRAMQVVVALCALSISAAIGFVYARETRVQGWQLWAWAASVVVVVLALLPTAPPPLPHWRAWVAPIGLTLVALLLRAPLLESVPGGLHTDEIGMARFAWEQVFPERTQTVNPFRIGGVYQATLYHYLLRLSMELAGYTIAGLRITSALAGSLGVLATYAAVAAFQGRRAGLITATVMATYHFHIHWSRLALANIWDTLWVRLALAAFAWGWKERWSGGAVIAGLALGLSQYFYTGSKIAWLLLPYGILWLWRRYPSRYRAVIHGGKLALVAVTTAAPHFLLAWLDPDSYFTRARQVFGWTPEAIQITIGRVDYWEYFRYQLSHAFAGFVIYPDMAGGFYRPGVPLAMGMSAPLLVIGVLWAVRQGQSVPVVWLLLTALFGGFLLQSAPASSHYTSSFPAICWLVAIPIASLYESGRRWMAAFLLSMVILVDLGFYFGVYVPRPDVDLRGVFPTLSR